MVLDFNSLQELARAKGEDWKQILAPFRAQGVQSLAFSELHLEDLEGYGLCTAYSGAQWGAETRLGNGPAPLPQAQSTYLVHWGDSPLPLDLLALCSETFGAGKVKKFEFPGALVIEIGLPLKQVQSFGLGFPAWIIESARQQGMSVWIRPENKPPVSDEGVRAYLAALESKFQPEGVIFGGASNEVVGYPEHLEETSRQIEAFGWKLGFIELPKATQQKGIETLVRALPLRTVRVFAVPPAQLATVKPPRLSQMFSLAARERNLSLLYLRPYGYDPTPDKGFVEANERFFSAVYSDLKDRLGPASTFEVKVEVKPWQAALLSLGGLAGVWLIGSTLTGWLPRWWAVTLVAFAGLNALMLLTPLSHLWLALMALGSACSISSAAVISQFPKLRRAAQSQSWLGLMTSSTGCWLVMSLLSLAGAWIASAFLQETTYKLGLDIFRGVKVLTVLTPLAIALAWALTAEERPHWMALSSSPLRLYQLIGMAVLVVGGLVYTMRTGNMSGDMGGEALEYERLLRMWLDNWLGVRPRFKEFMLAHPAMLLIPFAIRWSWRELTLVLLLVGSLGQCGLCDTFAHVHTPLQISLVRCLLGMALGGLAGWFYAAILWPAARGLLRVERKH